MHAQQAYQIKAISTNSAGSGSAEGTFTTGTLPAQIPVGQVMINETARVEPGWTLMNVQRGQGDTRARSDFPPYAVMYDSSGQPVWYYVDGTNPDIGGAVSVDLTDKGVLIGATLEREPHHRHDADRGRLRRQHAVAVLDRGLRRQQATSTTMLSKLSNGNYMLLESVTTSGVQNPVFREVSPSNQVVSSLEFARLVPPPSGSTGDWCHGNAITVDIANNAIYANCRYAGPAQDHLHEPAPRCGTCRARTSAPGIGDMTFSPTSVGVQRHARSGHSRRTARSLSTTTGAYSGGVGGTTSQFRSRIVEYQINDTANTATLTWEFPAAPPSQHLVHHATRTARSGAACVARPTATTWSRPGSGATPGRAAASSRSPSHDKKVVWEFRFPPDYGVYRARRITPPLVRAITP